ncbi:MAG: tetratricopeptide repeat protein [Clostridiales bacterium]|nr:tetratricopeptide repeat protein [Clostridia bacterium]MCR4564280.1 tetratricopeptide repeat protein [Clostridiales bacterium]
MSYDKGYLTPEDYAEPRCLLCDEPYGVTKEVKPVPQQRIIQKMNEYMSKRDYQGAERHLKYWLEEAKLGHDKGGELLIRNELVGHYRKTGEKENAFESAGEALRLIKELDFENHVSAGTTYVNCATAYNAFGENEKSLELFRKAKAVYESNENTSPELLGGLYNNMALTNVALKNFDEAFSLYEKALKIMDRVENGVLEQAITYLNMADALEAKSGFEENEKTIFEYLDKAYDLLNDENVKKDGYYAFVCEKCAPCFSYYGYFAAADELNKKAESIYERD